MNPNPVRLERSLELLRRVNFWRAARGKAVDVNAMLGRRTNLSRAVVDELRHAEQLLEQHDADARDGERVEQLSLYDELDRKRAATG